MSALRKSDAAGPGFAADPRTSRDEIASHYLMDEPRLVGGLPVLTGVEGHV